MALSCKVGSFTITATGNKAITGLGFQPKVVLFWGSRLTADGFGAHVQWAMGVAVSSTSRASVGSGSQDNVTTTVSNERHTNALCLSIPAYTGAQANGIDFVSHDADGFTVNVTEHSENAIVNWMALGGADLTNVSLDKRQVPSTTGNQAYTGLGFQPDALIVFGDENDSASFPSNAAHLRFSLGMYDGTNQVCSVWGSTNNVTTSRSYRYQVTNRLFATLFADATRDEASGVSLDADGYTFNWNKVTGANDHLWVLALKGGQYKIGTDTQKTSTGTKATTGVGFQPTGILLSSVGTTTNAAVNAEGRFSMGAASAATERASTWCGDADNLGTTQVDTSQEQDEVIQFADPGTPTLLAEADLSSLDADGFTLNWTTADATAREFGYLAVGSDAAIAESPSYLSLLGVG